MIFSLLLNLLVLSEAVSGADRLSMQSDMMIYPASHFPDSTLSGEIDGDMERWVDSVYSSLSLDERIAGLFLVDAVISEDIHKDYELAGHIIDSRPGGIIVRSSGQRAGYVKEYIGFLQNKSSLPLIIAATGGISGDGGFRELPHYPSYQSLAAIQDDRLFYELGAERARQYKLLGFDLMFYNMYPAVGNELFPVKGNDIIRDNATLLPGNSLNAWIRGMYAGGMPVAQEDRESRTGIPAGLRDAAKTGSAREFADYIRNQDLLFYTSDIPSSVSRVKDALEKGLVCREFIEEKSRQILEYKYHNDLARIAGEYGYNGQSSGFLESADNGLLKRKLTRASVTLLLNRDDAVPVRNLDKGKFVLLEIGRTGSFISRVRDYVDMPVISPDTGSPMAFGQSLDSLEGYDRIIVSVSETGLFDDHSFNDIIDRMMQILTSRESIIMLFGPSSLISAIDGIEEVRGLAIGYEGGELVQDLSAQMLFGAHEATGRLPVDSGTFFPERSGLSSPGGLRLKYSIPEESGLDSKMIVPQIDSIVTAGIKARAFPGCRVLLAHKGMIIVDKAYGHHTYAKRIRVDKNDLYDLASVTKITGPLPIYMKLVDEGKLNLDLPLSHYWDDWQNRFLRRSNKDDLVFRDLLTHQSGITPYINYWEQTLRNGSYQRRWYSPERSGKYALQISDHLYLPEKFKKKVYRAIRKSELLSHGEYRYSCLPFIVSPEVISEIDGRQYTDALYNDFYRPLGASSLRYNPLDIFSVHRIVPTEVDNGFRRQLVHGYVHDEASAVLGGVSGNAGLFSTAGDLAKLMQLYLNKGEYGGKRYLSEEVVNEFTSVQFPENNNRRGIGFDKPVLDNKQRPPERAYPSEGASDSSFGHSGFTGTFVWIDPEFDLMYVFLSNRVYPTRENNLISNMNIRTDILQVLYDAIKESRK